MEEIPRQGVRQLPRHNPRELSGFGVEAVYLENFPAYNRIYGSIGAVAALLMSLYVSAYALLLGAAVDAERTRGRRQ
jgi:hypothetical protein